MTRKIRFVCMAAELAWSSLLMDERRHHWDWVTHNLHLPSGCPPAADSAESSVLESCDAARWRTCAAEVVRLHRGLLVVIGMRESSAVSVATRAVLAARQQGVAPAE